MYENDCSNCKAVYLDKFKRFFKSGLDEHKNLSKIAIMKTTKLQTTVGEKIAILPGRKRNLLVGKTG